MTLTGNNSSLYLSRLALAKQVVIGSNWCVLRNARPVLKVSEIIGTFPTLMNLDKPRKEFFDDGLFGNDLQESRQMRISKIVQISAQGVEQILLCLRHIGLRPDRAGFLRT